MPKNQEEYGGVMDCRISPFQGMVTFEAKHLKWGRVLGAKFIYFNLAYKAEMGKHKTHKEFEEALKNYGFNDAELCQNYYLTILSTVAAPPEISTEEYTPDELSEIQIENLMQCARALWETDKEFEISESNLAYLMSLIYIEDDADVLAEEDDSLYNYCKEKFIKISEEE